MCVCVYVCVRARTTCAYTCVYVCTVPLEGNTALTCFLSIKYYFKSNELFALACVI